MEGCVVACVRWLQTSAYMALKILTRLYMSGLWTRSGSLEMQMSWGPGPRPWGAGGVWGVGRGVRGASLPQGSLSKLSLIHISEPTRLS